MLVDTKGHEHRIRGTLGPLGVPSTLLAPETAAQAIRGGSRSARTNGPAASVGRAPDRGRAAGRRLDRHPGAPLHQHCRDGSRCRRRQWPLPSPRHSTHPPQHPGQQHSETDRTGTAARHRGCRDPSRVRSVHRRRGRSIGDGLREGLVRPDTSRGITYIRSSGDGTFKLQAAAIWEITGTGTGGELSDGTFGNDQAVTVQEIQAAADHPLITPVSCHLVVTAVHTHRREWAMASHRFPMGPSVPLSGTEKARWK